MPAVRISRHLGPTNSTRSAGITARKGEITFKFSSNVVGDSNDENNFLYKLLLTNTQISIRKAFANNSSVNIKLSKTKLHKIEQSEGFLGRILGLLLKFGLPLIGNAFKPLDKSVFALPLALTASASATDAAIYKKMFGFGCHHSDLASRVTTLIITN